MFCYSWPTLVIKIVFVSKVELLSMTTKKTAKSPKKKYHVWNVFLLKKDYSSKDKYLSPLKKGANLTEHAISIPTAKNAILFNLDTAGRVAKGRT